MCSGQYRDTYHDTTNVLYGLSLTLPIPNQMIACSQENNRKNVCACVCNQTVFTGIKVHDQNIRNTTQNWIPFGRSIDRTKQNENKKGAIICSINATFCR